MTYLLSLGLDNLSPRSIKCVFVGYFRTQMGYQCYNPSVSADVMFLSLFYISLHSILLLSLKLFLFHYLLPAPAFDDSLPGPLVDISKLHASKPVRDFRYVYTYHQKVPAAESAPVDSFPVDGPPSQPSARPSHLDILITLRKGNRSCTNHPISKFASYDHLNPSFH